MFFIIQIRYVINNYSQNTNYFGMQKFLFLVFLKLIVASNPILPEHSLPVYGNASLGYYYVKIYVGHPPQQQSVIIDTGSGQLALPCNKCTSCNPKHINTPFDMSKSKSAQYLTCQSNQSQCKRCSNKNPTESCKFVISYAQGSSLQGIIIKDSIQFQSFSQGQQIITSFGCTTRQTNLFLKQQANGIFGLSPQRTSNLLEDLYQKHHGYSGQELEFSLCLSGNGGIMNIGKVNKALHSSQQSFKTTFSSQRNLYSLNGVGEIKIADAVIRKQNDKFGIYGIFIDSGSTFSYFPYQNYNIFKEQLIKNCSQHKQLCEVAHGQSTFCFHIRGNSDILYSLQKIFPPIVLKFGQKQIKWNPQKYFLLRDITNRQVCLGVQSLDRYLLGANWMVDKDVVFNIKQKTVQIFQNANCLGKQNPIKYISQYTQEADGHKPLNYQSESIIKLQDNSDLIIVLGIIFIFIGLAGVLIVILRSQEKSLHKRHDPLSPVQTEDHFQTVPAVSKSSNRQV